MRCHFIEVAGSCFSLQLLVLAKTQKLHKNVDIIVLELDEYFRLNHTVKNELRLPRKISFQPLSVNVLTACSYLYDTVIEIW